LEICAGTIGSQMFTQYDKALLKAVGIATGEVEFDLETAWMQFFNKNKNRDFSPCRFCDAQSYQQHTLDCPGGTPIIF
jgi:hypothetical protein